MSALRWPCVWWTKPCVTGVRGQGTATLEGEVPVTGAGVFPGAGEAFPQTGKGG